MYAGEDYYEPDVECWTCRQYRKIRWYQQAMNDWIRIDHPKTGQARWYGRPYTTCPKCHKGPWQGVAAGRSGVLLVRYTDPYAKDEKD